MNLILVALVALGAVVLMAVLLFRDGSSQQPTAPKPQKQDYTTLEDHTISWLVKRGLTDDEARAVLAKYKRHSIGECMVGKWHEDTSAHSNKRLALITKGIFYVNGLRFGPGGRIVRADDSERPRERELNNHLFKVHEGACERKGNYRLFRVDALAQRGHAVVYGERTCPSCGKRLEAAFGGPDIPTKVICSCGWSEVYAIQRTDLLTLPAGELQKVLGNA